MNPLLEPLKELVRVIRNFEVGDPSPIMDELFDAEAAIELAEQEERIRSGKIQWLTTYPSGRSHTHGADNGQTGWRLHAVYATEQDKLPLKRVRSVCGIRPRQGWGLDLFIEQKCRRCSCPTCNGDGKIMSAIGDPMHPLKAIECPKCKGNGVRPS